MWTDDQVRYLIDLRKEKNDYFHRLCAVSSYDFFCLNLYNLYSKLVNTYFILIRETRRLFGKNLLVKLIHDLVNGIGNLR